jgi:hypothetical protein
MGMIEQVAGGLGIDLEAVLRKSGVAAEKQPQRRAADSGEQIQAVTLTEA